MHSNVQPGAAHPAAYRNRLTASRSVESYRCAHLCVTSTDECP